MNKMEINYKSDKEKKKLESFTVDSDRDDIEELMKEALCAGIEMMRHFFHEKGISTETYDW